jgi:hypothetical protein
LWEAVVVVAWTWAVVVAVDKWPLEKLVVLGLVITE